MDGMDIIMFFWSILLSLVGLFIVILQKKGLVKADMRLEITKSSLGLTRTSFKGICGGVFVYTGAFAGFMVLRKYSSLWAFLYAGIVAAIYIFIQIIYYKKKNR